MEEISIKKEKQKDEKLQKKLYIIGFFVISIIGTILHFIFEFSNNNILVAPFSAVNESVWEHLKIAVMPMFLWTFVEFITLKFRRANLWSSLLIKIFTVMGIITIFHYIYTGIFKAHSTWFSITIFYIAILLAQIFGYKEVTSKDVNVKHEEFSKYLVIMIFIMFVIFTFIPPKIDIFRDEVTSTYGVFELKY
jgi:hypothetical protein